MNRITRSIRLALALVAVVAVGVPSVDAAEKKNSKPKVDYPNATRKDPKPTSSDIVAKKLGPLFDKANNGGGEELIPEFQAVIDRKGATKYEQALGYEGISNVEYNSDHMDRAIEANLKAIELDALDNNSHIGLIYSTAQLYLQEEKYAEAVTWVDRWFKESGSTKPDALALRGNALFRLDRFADAADSMEKAIAASEKVPSDSWYQILLACYAEQGQFDKAKAIAETAMAKDPNTKKVPLLLASMYLQNNKDAEALEILERLNGKGLLTDATELKQLYQLYNFLGKPDKAEATINAAVEKKLIAPSFETYSSLGNGYTMQAQNDEDAKKDAEAKAAYRRAVDNFAKAAALSKDGEADYNRGNILIQYLDDFAEGAKAMQAAIAKGGFKHEGESWLLLGNARQQLNDDAGALQAFQKAAGFESTKKSANQMLDNIKRNKARR